MSSARLLSPWQESRRKRLVHEYRPMPQWRRHSKSTVQTRRGRALLTLTYAPILRCALIHHTTTKFGFRQWLHRCRQGPSRGGGQYGRGRHRQVDLQIIMWIICPIQTVMAKKSSAHGEDEKGQVRKRGTSLERTPIFIRKVSWKICFNAAKKPT
jgi:hypothetical protein